MAGIVVNNVTGAIQVGGSGTPLVVKDDDGFTIKNSAGTNSVNLAASAATTLTITGTVAVTVGFSAASITDSGLTSGRVTFAGASGLLSDSTNLTFNTGTNTLTATNISGVIASSSITDSGLTAGRVIYTSTGGLLAADANHTWDTTNSIETITGRLTITAGTLGTTGFSAQTVTVTLPNTSTAETGISETITLNGTGSSVDKRGRRMVLAAGSYTSASSTILLDLNSSAVGTGTAQNIPTAASSGPANKGIYVLTDGATVGTNIGGYFEGKGGAISIGAIGKAVSTSGVTSNIGLIGCANDTTTNAIGVYATLNNSADPVYTRGQYALVVDNGPNVSTQHCVGIFSQAATYFTIKNLGPWTIRTDPLASGTIAYDQAYSMPVSSADETCSLRTFTSAGTTSAGIKSGDKILINSGYTGAGTLNGLYIQFDAVGTGADLRLNTAGNLPLGNIGQYVAVNGSTTTGYNIGVYGSPRQGLKNFGVVGRAVVATNATHNVGLIGSAINASTANVGVFAGLAVGDNPTLTTTALLADNGSTAASIFIARDNGTAKFTIADGGDVSIANFATAGTVVYNSSSGGLLAATAVGTSGQALLSAGSSAPAFGNLGTSAGGTGLSGATPFNSNGVMYASSTSALTTLANGTTGQVLLANTSAAPSWGTAPGGISGLSSGLVPYSTSATAIATDAQLAWSTSLKTFTLGDFGTTKTKMTHQGGTLTAGESAFSMSSTTLASGTGDEIGAVYAITPAGSGATGTQTAVKVSLSAGYTGTGRSNCLFLNNAANSTGTSVLLGSSLVGDVGLWSDVTNSSSGNKYGVVGRASSGNGNTIGVLGENGASSAVGIGVFGNSGAGTIKVGVYAGLLTATPSFASAALVANNGTVAAPIFLAIDGTTPSTVFTIADGGGVTSVSNAGVTIQAADATEGVKWRTLHVNTTNTATQTEMTFDGAAASGTNTLQLANTTTHLYVVWITARATAGTNIGKMAAWRLEYVGDGASGTAVLVGSITETIITVNGMTWDVTASFTSTRTQLLVTGDAATTIHWTAIVQETTVS